jgi:membrane-associated phospholipid phosphatase
VRALNTTPGPNTVASVADWLVDRYGDTQTAGGKAVRELSTVDHAVYDAVAHTPTPTIDTSFRRLSTAANYSRLWFGVATAVALVGGRRGRRAALNGVVAIGATSAMVNLGVKSWADRTRPDRDEALLADEREAHMPSSSSFPSGHSASAFAFAAAVGDTVPPLALPLRVLAAGVAYSRVHTGVHYPGDVVVGSLIGAGMGDMTATNSRRLTAHRAPPD